MPRTRCPSLLVLLSLIGCQGPPVASADNEPEPVPTHPELRAELLARMEKDQSLRKQSSAGGEAAQAAAKECMRVDADNTAWLEQVVARHGWPSRTLVGKDGAFAAWLLVQHADQSPDFQARVLPTLQQLAERGEVEKRNVAYLTDRVLRAQGKPQIYGTQYSAEPDGHGGFVYLPPIVIDPDQIDARRADAGLGPWIEYERQMALIQNRTEIFAKPRGPAIPPGR